MKTLLIIWLVLYPPMEALSQDTVNVTFRYRAPSVQAWQLVGEFTNWGSAGIVMSTTDNVTYVATIPLLITGQPGGYISGAYEYKFFYSGISGTWPNDPLNPRSDGGRNDNSIIYVRNPTIYQFLPNQVSGIVRTSVPVISAYLFPKVGTVLDTGSLIVTVDTVQYTNVGKFYDFATQQFQFPVPVALRNGQHRAFVSAGSVSDSVNFAVQAGFIQIASQGGYSTWNPLRMVRGVVVDTAIHSVNVIRNSFDTTFANVVSGVYSITDTLTEGKNTFKTVVDTGGITLVSDSVTYTLLANHTPNAAVTVTLNGSSVTLDASSSIDPDSQSISYTWLDDSTYQLGIAGSHALSVAVAKPALSGEYYFGLIAQDPDGNADTLRSYFVVNGDGSIATPTFARNPTWAKRARIYFLFPKAASAAGTINAASLRLPLIKAMGFNVVWLMPIVKNAYPINNGTGPGYNIVDFYNVAPEYGTNQDFKNLVDQAHALGLKVILDITPNHTSRFHPWSSDAHTFKQDSRYWTWYEHSIIPHNDNGLGQSLDGDGFNYYSGFSDQLLNVNWGDVDLRTEMINVYKYWIKNYGVDGYRFDVYWGPHRRYGEQYMGIPVRTALKHIKPDILLLGEDDGTGSGTEVIYADHSGGLDAAYDFNLYFNGIRGFGFDSGGIDNLDNLVQNSGYYPGPNSLYMRFMESQDEDRITYFYSGTNFSIDAVTTFERTMPMATVLFTAPGVPMIWNGQEVGWGYGITGTDKLLRNRSLIDWSYQGKDLLMPHYQRLAQIRAQFPAFTTQVMKRMNTGNSLVYGFTRPYANANAVVAANMSSLPQSATFILDYTNLSAPIADRNYFITNLYADTSSIIQFSGGKDTMSISLMQYGSAVFIIADSVVHLQLPPLTSVGQTPRTPVPSVFRLYQNYPNPFNPSTTLAFDLAQPGNTSLKIYNILGQEIARLVDGYRAMGQYRVVWDGSDYHGHPAKSGVYFARLQSGSRFSVTKLLLIR